MTVPVVLPEALIVRVVASYVPLQQRGAEYVGRCPLCASDALALAVRPQKGRIQCSRCGADHDALGFIRAMEGIGAMAARRRLETLAWEPVAPIVQEGGQPRRGRKKPPRKPPIRERCGAYARSTGEPCRAHLCRRPDGSIGKRCKNHGGLSTGPRTPEGKARTKLNLLRTPSHIAAEKKRSANAQAPIPA